MKNKIFIFFAVFAYAVMVTACDVEQPVDFNVDADTMQMGPEGGVVSFNVNSDDSWIATVQAPWVTVSPANGNGSVECKVMVDSALAVTSRETTIRIVNQVTNERQEFKIQQEGFKYSVEVADPVVEVESYAAMEKRTFNVKVKTNFHFDIAMEGEDTDWLSYEIPELVLDRNARPREVSVKFSWDVNFTPKDRNVLISFLPKDSQIKPEVSDNLKVNQAGAEEIEIGVQGDSLALVAINRALGCWSEWEVDEKMEFWDGVEVWKSGKNKGRVKKAEFYMFGTKEGIPFQVKYLTAAEELYFFGNTNTFLLNVDPGEHICELENLRKLTIGAYGLSTLPASFSKLKNLEYLDISSNNFQSLPEVLTPENFPKLTALIMNACQRNTIYDLANTNKTDFGGLFEEADVDDKGNKYFPKRFLRWTSLDTLRLSVNYLEGVIPDLMDDSEFPKWTAEEVHACDTLPDILIGLPKVLPETDLFSINLNRLHGDLPDWLLYHPKLDLWFPESLVFLQEGKTSYGTAAGFANQPANLDYYYEHYVNKVFNPANTKQE